MSSFIYKARDKFGTAVSGQMEAETSKVVATHLSDLGYFIIQIKEKNVFPLRERLGESLRRVKPEDLIIFTRQLATMIGAGLPFLTCLDILTEQTRNRQLKGVIRQIRKSVEGGSSFSQALSRHPRIFPDLYVNMIRAGEAGGVLDVILDRLATVAEREEEVRTRIKSALRYPLVLVLAAALVVIFMVTFVLPRFLTIFTGKGIPLPLPTRILFSAVNFLRSFWPLIILIVGGGAIFFYFYLQSEEGRRRWDGFKLRFPLIGNLFLKAAVSRFSRILGVLNSSGVPILQSLEIAERTVGNAVLARVVNNVQARVREGGNISEPLAVSKVFPPMVSQMIAVGENTGTLDNMLSRIANYYDLEVEYGIKNVTSLVEPILLVIMGLIVGFIALSTLLPIFSMTKIFR